jgi:hypothetical protein
MIGTAEFGVWPSVIAFLAGGIAGLGIFRSGGWVLGLALGLGLAQIIGWMVLPLALLAEARTEDWNTVLWANFLLSLTVVVPYTTIGALVASGIISLARLVSHRKTGN